MELVRFKHNGHPCWGAVTDSGVRLIRGSPYERVELGETAGALDALELLPPCEPVKVVALAYNYKSLVWERQRYDEPLFFLKSPTGVIGTDSAIVIPPGLAKVWVEVELAFVVKRTACRVGSQEARDYILGFTIANDVTAANVHGRDHHLARSKAIDTFCPVGRVLHTELPSADLQMMTRVNGIVTQQSRISDRILNDSEALSLISQFMTLEPGDLVLTGTPAGAMQSAIRPGDQAILTIERVGVLNNPIIAGKYD